MKEQLKHYLFRNIMTVSKCSLRENHDKSFVVTLKKSLVINRIALQTAFHEY